MPSRLQLGLNSCIVVIDTVFLEEFIYVQRRELSASRWKG